MLRENARMLKFVESFGFATREDPGIIVLDLAQKHVAGIAGQRA